MFNAQMKMNSIEDPIMDAFQEMELIKERGNWGGEEVLQAFGKIYEVVIEIFKHDGTSITINANNGTKNLKIFYSGNHYDSIVQEQEPNRQPKANRETKKMKDRERQRKHRKIMKKNRKAS